MRGLVTVVELGTRPVAARVRGGQQGSETQPRRQRSLFHCLHLGCELQGHLLELSFFPFLNLGLGDDGHTASLVPGDDALKINDRDVATTAVYRGHRRMTLTYAALDRARCRLWLATGADKGSMLSRLRDADADIPAGRVSRVNSVVFCDAAAANAMT